nr:hypothetical protein [Tanacetum cinerariifolium]
YPEIHLLSQETSDKVFQANHFVQNEESSNEITVSNSNQEKEEPPQDFDICQLIREECSTEVSEEQKQKSDKVTESNAKNLLPIPSECEVALEDKGECDVPISEKSPVCDNHSDIFSDSKDDDDISVYDDFEDVEYVEASLSDHEIVSVEEENVVQQEEEVDFEDISQIQDVVLREKLLSITRLISNIKSLNDNSTPDQADLFLAADNSIPPGIENFADDPEGDIRFLEKLLIYDSILYHESSDYNFEDNSLILRPPPEPPDVKTDAGEEIPVVINNKDKDVDYSSFIFIFDKIAHALEITKLKQRVKKLERRNKLKEGIITNIDADEDVVLKDSKDVAVEKSADVLSMREEESEPAELQEVVDVVTTAKIITEVVTAASDTITAASTTITAANVPIPAPTITATPSRRRKGVVIRDPEETTTTSTIIYSEAKSKDKGKRILVEEPKPLKKQAQIKQDEKYARELEAEMNKNIDWDEVIDHVQRKQKEDKAVKRYQALKKKPQTEAQARKNMMIYLRNTKDQMDEEDSRALKRLNESQEDKAAKKYKLDEEVEELKRHLHIVPNDEDDRLVKERFATTKPKNFSDDFLLITLDAMFEKPDIQAQIWKNQRSVYGQVKVKSWKLLESYEEESKVSLELLSFGVDAAMDFKENMLSV